MTLIITVISAIIVTLIWYMNSKARSLKCGILCYMYWGASVMWLVDAIAEYIETGAEYFNTAPADMLNDAFLGISAVTIGLIIWVVYVLVKDPLKIIRNKKNLL